MPHLGRIRESFIQRGIGTSGLASRAIQQQNIEDTRGLQQALQESQATRGEERRQRAAQDASRLARASTARQQAFRGGGQPAGGFGVGDVAILNVVGGPERRSVFAEQDPEGRTAVLTFAGGGNIREQRRFSDPGAAVEFARARGLQVRLSGTPQPSRVVQTLLERGAITPISVGEARDVVGSFVTPGISQQTLGSLLRGGGGRREAPTPVGERSFRRTPGTAQRITPETVQRERITRRPRETDEQFGARRRRFNIGRLTPETRRVGIFNQLNILRQRAAAGDARARRLLNASNQAFRQGRGEEFFQEALRTGAINGTGTF